MNEIDNLYRHFKAGRKSDRRETIPRDSAPPDEVDSLYQQYQQNREPDFDKSIALVMSVAKAEVEADRSVAKVMNQVNDRSNAVTQDKQQPEGFFKTLFKTPGRIVNTVDLWLKHSNMTQGNRVVQIARVALPAIAVAAIAIGVFNYSGTNQTTSGFDLVFAEPVGNSQSEIEAVKVSSMLSGYIDGVSPTTSLAFSGQQNEALRAFTIGTNSIDLQIASLAKEKALVDQSSSRIAELLSDNSDEDILNGLSRLRIMPAVDYTTASDLMAAVMATMGDSEMWFVWGRSIQSVQYTSQLALDGGPVEPMKRSILDLEKRYGEMGETHLTPAEKIVAGKIAALSAQSDFTAEQYRLLRDSARDLKALRQHGDK